MWLSFEDDIITSCRSIDHRFSSSRSIEREKRTGGYQCFGSIIYFYDSTVGSVGILVDTVRRKSFDDDGNAAWMYESIYKNASAGKCVHMAWLIGRIGIECYTTVISSAIIAWKLYGYVFGSTSACRKRKECFVSGKILTDFLGLVFAETGFVSECIVGHCSVYETEFICHTRIFLVGDDHSESYCVASRDL